MFLYSLYVYKLYSANNKLISKKLQTIIKYAQYLEHLTYKIYFIQQKHSTNSITSNKISNKSNIL